MAKTKVPITRRELLLRPVELPDDQKYSAGNLRALMADVGLTREDVAALVGVHWTTMRHWLFDEGAKQHRDMPAPSWELLLLKTDRHPKFILMEKV